jgi:two-component system LytT family response regulator
MPNVLLVDDESLARKRLRSFLEQRPELITIEEAASGREALEKLRAKKYDLVFLDVEMPGMSGFELLAQWESRVPVIFQTAYADFALRAFEANACDYLLKPFPKERFDQAFERALARKAAGEALQKVETALRENSGYLSKLLVKLGNKSVFVELREALAIVSRDHYSFLLTAEKEYILELSLSHLEERLDPKQFQRLHRNSIVQLSAIAAVHGGENMEVELKSGLRLPVSRSSRGKLKDWK